MRKKVWTYFLKTPRKLFSIYICGVMFRLIQIAGSRTTNKMMQVTKMVLSKVLFNYNPWMWNLATTPTWSDLICLTLWRNDAFLHPFCNFSKSNAFSKNLVRTKFILYKIFFRMSIFSSSKTAWIFFSLRWKNCEKPFVGGHDYFEGKWAFGDKNQ